jgi:hypothetical protein
MKGEKKMWNKLTKKQIELIPKLGSQGEKSDPKVYAKFFLGSWTWYVTEMEGDIMFAFVTSPMVSSGEFGSVSYSELVSLKAQGWVEVDREVYQVNPRQPKLLSKILDEDNIKHHFGR